MDNLVIIIISVILIFAGAVTWKILHSSQVEASLTVGSIRAEVKAVSQNQK